MRILRLIIAILILMQTATSFAQKRKTTAKKTIKTTKVVTPVDPLEEKANAYRQVPIVKVMFTDSLVTTEKDLSQVIPLPPYAGLLRMVDTTLVYENEFGDTRLLSHANEDGHQRIYRQILIGNKWGAEEPVRFDEELTDMRSPFLLADGQTLMFSARDNNDAGNESYNIYMSVMDTETGAFRKPQQLPLPFLSNSDDMYMIEDEVDSLAWLVSRRGQVGDSVCIYTLRLDEPWEYYDTEYMGAEKVIRLAEVHSIADTWKNEAVRMEELQRIEGIKNHNHMAAASKADVFYLNDKKGITDASQLSSTAAREAYQQYINDMKLLDELEIMLDNNRKQYHNADASKRRMMAQKVADMEQEVANLRERIKQGAKAVREQE